MFTELINGLLSTLGFTNLAELDPHIHTTFHDPKQGMKGGVDNIKCIILNSFLTNTNSSVNIDLCQPLLPSGWTCSKADFYTEDTAMLLTEFKISASELKLAPRGILINRSGSVKSSATDLFALKAK